MSQYTEVYDWEINISKEKKTLKKYYFESPFITIQNPRPLEAYLTMIELFFVRNGLKGITKDYKINSKSNERCVSFNGKLSASNEAAKSYESMSPNILLLFLSAITMIYSVVSFFLYPGFFVILPIAVLFLFESGYAFYLYSKELKKERRELTFYHSKSMFLIEMISSGIILLLLIIMVIIAIFTYYLPRGITITLGIIVILISILIIARCFNEFKTTKTTITQSGKYIHLIVDIEGIIYQKSFMQNSELEIKEEGSEGKKLHRNEKTKVGKWIEFKDVDKIEIKFYLYPFLADDEMYERNHELIYETKENIFSILASKPVELRDHDTMEQPIEAPLLKDNELRIFPLSYDNATIKRLKFVDEE